jgi:1-acyl-sn-glycerol-3-phosphate acyltransferase
MTIARSIAFNLLFYVVLAVLAIVGLPMLLTRRGPMRLATLWARISIWLLEVVAGIRVEVRGREKIPPGGCLVAAKHQSALETLALVPLFPHFTYILKRELNWIPVFGWYTMRAGMIPVNRGARSAALRAIAEHARRAIAERRQIIIFPEGTRRPVGAEPVYKHGVTHLYSELGVPCVPVALNTGLFWPRRSFLRRPGTAVIEVLDPIPPGLDGQAFRSQLQEVLETATNRLLREAEAARPDAPPLTPEDWNGASSIR